MNSNNCNKSLEEVLSNLVGPSPRDNPFEMDEGKWTRLIEELKDSETSTEEDPNDPFID